MKFDIGKLKIPDSDGLEYHYDAIIFEHFGDRLDWIFDNLKSATIVKAIEDDPHGYYCFLTVSVEITLPDEQMRYKLIWG